MSTTYRAVIFDMDGVLVDSEPVFFQAANQVLAGEDKGIEWERYQHLLGTSVPETWRALIAMLDLKGDLDAYLRRYARVLLDCLRERRPPLPGVVELLEELGRREIRFGLATSSWRAWAEAELTSAELDGRFAVTVTGDEVTCEKPAPDIYLRAAELLDVSPEHCIAIEDTPPGIASAKAAGMYAVQVRASSTAVPPIEQADLVLDSLADFPLSMLA